MSTNCPYRIVSNFRNYPNLLKASSSLHPDKVRGIFVFPPSDTDTHHVIHHVSCPLISQQNPRGSLTRTIECPCHAVLISIRVPRSVVHVTSDPADQNRRPRISETCSTFNAPTLHKYLLATLLIRLLSCWGFVKSVICILTYAANLRRFR